MRYLVTGGGGFIGSHVASRLAGEGHHVTIVDIAFPELRHQWWRTAARRVTCDLSVTIPHWALRGADRVFHFAADMGGVGYFHSPADPRAAEHNLRIDLGMFRACREHDVNMFYASSACMYPESRVPLHEGLIGQGPADQLYGEEKRFMTLLLASEPLARVGVFHTIYGPGQESEGPRAKFPPAICRKVKAGGEIEIWGDGSQVRTFLYIDDAVQKILTLATHAEYEGPVNIGSDEQVTVRQCADWLCDHARIERRYRFQADRPTGVLSRGCDSSEYDRRYGRLAQTPAADGLRRLYEWLP